MSASGLNGLDILSDQHMILTVDPLYAFAFLKTFIDILTEYFGTVSTVTLRENFDIVYQVSSQYSIE